MNYGYARVSSKSQNLARQMRILQEANVEKIFQEKLSGALTNRPALTKMLQCIKPGDAIFVVEMERLGRNNKDLKRIMTEVYLRGAQLKILDMPSFTEIKDDNLREYLTNMNIETRKFYAEMERKKIKARQKQRIELAKLRGVYKGRKQLYGPHVDNPDRRNLYIKIRQQIQEQLSVAQIMRNTGCSNTLVYRIKRELSS